MADLNRMTLLGRLGADPEVKSFQNGGRIANLRVATSEDWKDRTTGEKKTRVEWHSITIRSDGLIGVVENYLRKGSRVYIEGQLQTRKWQDRDGHDRYTTEIVIQGFGGKLIMLDGKTGSGSGSSGSGAGSSGGSGGWGSGGSGAGATNDQRMGGGHTSGTGGGGGWGSGSSGGKGGGGFADDLDDDIPFIVNDLRYERRLS